jgi:predicted MFS family arabinose efflux permease
MNAVAPVAVELVAQRVGWTTAFVSSGAGALACALLSLRLRDARGAGVRDARAAGLFALARRPSQLEAMLLSALVGSALSAVFAFHQLYALTLGIEHVSGFFAAYAAGAIVVRGGFGHLMDAWGLRRVAAGALALYVLVVLGVAQLERFGLVLLGAGIGVAHGIFYPAFNAVAVAAAGPGERGKVMALFQAAYQVGLAGGGVGYGLLAAAAGYPAVFRTAAAGLAFGLCVLLAGGLSASSAAPSVPSPRGSRAAP